VDFPEDMFPSTHKVKPLFFWFTNASSVLATGLMLLLLVLLFELLLLLLLLLL
jgi:formate-dependent nitrite reductase membrane component NrfD